MSSSEHYYEVNSEIGSPEIYAHKDQKTFAILFRKIMRLKAILESWFFGLCFDIGGRIYWINLEKDKYSSFVYLPKNSSEEIILHLAVMTYPFNSSLELWSPDAVSLIFHDVYSSVCDMKPPLESPELYAVEECLSKKEFSQKDTIITRTIPPDIKKIFDVKVKEYSGMTCYQLMRKYIGIVDRSNFEKTIAEFPCNKGELELKITKEHLSVSNSGSEKKYEWNKVKVNELDGKICSVSTVDSSQIKMQFKFDCKDVAKQCHYLMEKTLLNDKMFHEPDFKSEVSVIERIVTKEQCHVENAEKLESEYAMIITSVLAIESENQELKKKHAVMKAELERLSEAAKLLIKEVSEHRTSSSVPFFKTPVEYILKKSEVSSMAAKESENESLKKELTALEADKSKEVDRHRKEITALKKKIEKPKIVKKGSRSAPNDGGGP